MERGILKTNDALKIYDVKSKEFVSKKNSLISMANDDSLITLFRLDDVNDTDRDHIFRGRNSDLSQRGHSNEQPESKRKNHSYRHRHTSKNRTAKPTPSHYNDGANSSKLHTQNVSARDSLGIDQQKDGYTPRNDDITFEEDEYQDECSDSGHSNGNLGRPRMMKEDTDKLKA